jgi:hypothetical protein
MIDDCIDDLAIRKSSIVIIIRESNRQSTIGIAIPQSTIRESSIADRQSKIRDG